MKTNKNSRVYKFARLLTAVSRAGVFFDDAVLRLVCDDLGASCGVVGDLIRSAELAAGCGPTGDTGYRAWSNRARKKPC